MDMSVGSAIFLYNFSGGLLVPLGPNPDYIIAISRKKKKNNIK